MKKEDKNEEHISDTDEETVTDRRVKSEEDAETHQAEAQNDTEIEFEEVNDEGEIDARATIKKLREKIKKLEEEKKEYLDLSQRTRADYANFKKEVESSRAFDRKFATRNLIVELLPVLDAYDMARGNAEAWEKVDSNWRIGVEHIFNQLKGILEKEGVIQFGTLGDTFDPHLYESVGTVPVEDESKDHTILQVLQKGYRIGETVLRPARVKTGEYKN